MNRRELEKAIRDEVERWPGATVELKEQGRGHPKAKLMFGGKILLQSYSGTPSDGNAVAVHLGQIRRALKNLGAQRDKPAPTEAEDRKTYHKSNGGAEKRPDPVQGERAKPRPSLADQLTELGVNRPGGETVEVPREVLESGEKLGTTIVGVVESVDEDGVVKVHMGPSKRQLAKAQAALIVDGIYFGLPMEVYREVARVGASGLCDLNVSPGDFWQNSWLNPDRDAENSTDEDDEEADKKKAKALLVGEAYHCARLEPDQFEVRYAREPMKADYPAKGLLTSDAAVKAALKEAGEQQTVTGETIVERCQRLLDTGYEGALFPMIKALFAESLNGRKAIPGKVWDDIERDMVRIHEHPEVGPLLRDGFPEVSVFWTDENNIQRKARFDWLAYEHWADFKTFDNSRRIRLEKAIANAIQYNRYYITAASYLEASDAIRTGKVQVVGDAPEAARDLITRLQIKPEQQRCEFVFQQKGGVPNLLAYSFTFYAVPDDIENIWDTGASEEAKARGHEATRRPTQLYSKARAEIDYAKRLFAHYSTVYRPGEPWAFIEARGRITDTMFSPHWLEGLYD